MSENTQSYSAKGEVSNITKRRTRFERIKIAYNLNNYFDLHVCLSIPSFVLFVCPNTNPVSAV